MTNVGSTNPPSNPRATQADVPLSIVGIITIAQSQNNCMELQVTIHVYK